MLPGGAGRPRGGGGQARWDHAGAGRRWVPPGTRFQCGQKPHSFPVWRNPTLFSGVAESHTLFQCGRIPHSFPVWRNPTLFSGVAESHTVFRCGRIPHSFPVWPKATLFSSVAESHTRFRCGRIPHSFPVWPEVTLVSGVARSHTVLAWATRRRSGCPRGAKEPAQSTGQRSVVEP